MHATTQTRDAALLPADEETRDVALELYAEVADAPILSPHGHVDPGILLRDEAFADPAELLITKDHYVTRLLFASGVPLDELGVGPTANADPRRIWRHLAENWHRFAGTASAYWLS